MEPITNEDLEPQVAQDAQPAEDEGDAAGGGWLHQVTAQTPWWVVSLLFHGLLIALAGVSSMVIDLGTQGSPIITMTELIETSKALPPEIKKPDPTQVLQKGVEHGDTTDSTLHKLVSAEFKAIAEESDRYTTAAPDDTHEISPDGAMGVQESDVIYIQQTPSTETGGGGNYGAAALEDTLGVGGAGSAGANGGWGGGMDGGIGPGPGKGTATFGNWRYSDKNRIPKRVGMPKGVPNSTDGALRWLAYHQEADGHWDSMRYGAQHKTDTAVTGFALLAFLGSGHTEKIGEHRGTVQRAVKWLISKQDAQGLIWDTTDAGGHRGKGYPCSIATLALVEAAAMGNVAETRAAAQKAVDYVCETHQNGEGSSKGGWRYGPKQQGDLSVSGWFVMALKSAKVGGLKVPTESFDGALNFLDRLEVKEAAAGGYGMASRYKYTEDNAHEHTAHRLTAIGALMRHFLNHRADELDPTLEWFVNKGGVPNYGANGESVDLYYWYYGTLVAYLHGNDALWKRWSASMIPATLDQQCTQGDDRGSWTPVGAYSNEWGRVGQTALNTLILQTYWRYGFRNK